jgi:hypothetical protein
MNYTVTWRPSAIQQFAGIWNDAADRDAVTAAANQMDSDLERNPRNTGESRSGRTRIHVVSPWPSTSTWTRRGGR